MNRIEKKRKERDRSAIRRQNPEYREKLKILQKNWRSKNRDHINARRRANRIHTPLVKKTKEELAQKARARNQNYYRKHKHRLNKERNERNQLRIKNDVGFRLKVRVRYRLWMALRGQIKKEKTLVLIGCSVQQLQDHLEKQFKPGMSWENYGRGGWTIDHIRPLSSFDLSNKRQARKACHYTNLQPLWELENIKKGSWH